MSTRRVEAVTGFTLNESNNQRTPVTSWRLIPGIMSWRGGIKDIRATDPLLALLEDDNTEVRVAATEALGKIKSDSALYPLVDLLNGKDIYMRLMAAEALEEIRDPRAVEPLLNILETEYSSVRIAAVSALGKIGDDRAINSLLTRLNDVNLYVVGATHTALHAFAVQRFSLGDLDGAIDIFAKLVKILPDDDLRNNLSFCFMLRGRYSEAAEQIEQIDYSISISNRPLWQNNRGLLSFLSGNEDKGKRQLSEALEWIDEAGENYDPRGVQSVLLLTGGTAVSAHEGVPVDAAVLINLFNMGGVSMDELSTGLSKRYPEEYEEWLRLLPKLEGQENHYVN